MAEKRKHPKQAKAKGPVCISVINMKGGVGKTTVAALLGRHASIALGLDVLAIDLDPQANLSQAFMRDRYEQFMADRSPSVVELFNGFRPPSSATPSPTPVVLDDVVVRNTPLGGPNLQLIPSRFDFSDQLVRALGGPDDRILANVIAAHFQDVDVVFIDCPPTESILTHVSYQASRHLLVPVRPEYFATVGFPLLRSSLDAFKRANRSHAIEVSGVVINNWAYHYSGNRGGPETQRSIEQIRSSAKKNDWHVFKHQIPYSRGFPKMMRGDFSNQGDAALFPHFAREFFNHIGLGADDEE